MSPALLKTQDIIADGLPSPAKQAAANILSRSLQLDKMTTVMEPDQNFATARFPFRRSEITKSVQEQTMQSPPSFDETTSWHRKACDITKTPEIQSRQSPLYRLENVGKTRSDLRAIVEEQGRQVIASIALS